MSNFKHARIVVAILVAALALGGGAGAALAQDAENAAEMAAPIDMHGPAGGPPEAHYDGDGHDHRHAHGDPHAGALLLSFDPSQVEPRVDIAKAIDLAAIRAMTVQDNGRRKPFDTLAREQVKFILGTPTYRGEDPVYTFLSLMFEPDRWMPIRAVKVHNLKVMDLLAETGAKGNRVSFADIEQSEKFRARLGKIDPSGGMNGPFENALLELNHRAMIFVNLPRVIRVAPIPGAKSADEEDAPAWSSLAELQGQPKEVRAEIEGALRAAATAFRAGDAPATSAALRTLAEKVRALQGDQVPEWKISLEVALNRVDPFKWAWMTLVLAAMLLGFAVAVESRKTYIPGMVALLAGVALGLFGLTARTLIVERAPVGNLYEATTFAIFSAVIVGTIFELTYRNGIFGTAAAGFGFLSLLLADLSPTMDRSINHLVPVLRSYWLNIHVTAMLVSYGAFAVAFGLAVMYFAKYLAAKGLPRFSIAVPIAIALGGTGILFYRAYTHQMPKIEDYALALAGTPVLAIFVTWLWLRVAGASERKIAFEDDVYLKSLEKHFYRVCQVGFMVITAGIILGAVWANESWGRYWDWDPKETWAFITWLVYGVYIHGRIAGIFRGPTAAIWGIIGFNAVLFTLFGVSFVLPGLHSYLK